MIMLCRHLQLRLFILTTFSVIVTSAQWAIDDKGCRTPGGGVGDCIVVKKCQSMRNFLQKAPKPMSRALVEAVQEYICGVANTGSLKVCCPSDPIKIDVPQNDEVLPLKNEIRVDKFAAPDVSGHPNLKLLPENCGNVDTDSKIINGEKAELLEFPWMALLWYRTGKNVTDYRCGASIINEKYILTAAHCVVNNKAPLIGVRIGEFDISTTIDSATDDDGTVITADPVQNLEIEEVVPHPDYNSTELLKNDIALIRISQPMKFSRTGAWPICLPLGKFGNFNYTKRFGTITGWGVTEKNRPSKTLMKAQAPLLSIEECKKTPAFEKKHIIIDDRQLCANSKSGVDSCKGDSGGPLQIVGLFNDEPRYIQHGIVSFGSALCRSQKIPGVYTRIAYYMDWILDNIRP